MMPRKTKKRRIDEVEEVIVTKPVVAVEAKPTTEVVTEKRVITTEPEIEIRRPATLAQALTERTVAVVKPRTRVRTMLHTRRVA
jgi:hypothetical protein